MAGGRQENPKNNDRSEFLKQAMAMAQIGLYDEKPAGVDKAITSPELWSCDL